MIAGKGKFACKDKQTRSQKEVGTDNGNGDTEKIPMCDAGHFSMLDSTHSLWEMEVMQLMTVNIDKIKRLGHLYFNICYIHCSKHLRDHSLDFGYFHPPKKVSNGKNIMLLSNDLSICTLMVILIEAQDAKQTRERLTYP